MEDHLHFSYSREDVCASLSGSSSYQCKLEAVLCETWERAMSGGVFRYDLTGVTTRTLPGNHGFIVQCNPKRYTHRRAPSSMSSLKQDFNPSLFNFNKIREEEILFEVSRLSDKQEVDGWRGGGGTSSSVGEVVGRHLVLVNVSPITYGHALLIPDPKACLPQVWTRDSLRLCLDLMALSSQSRGFCIVANSLLAHASVNHLHYHILFVKEPVLAATVKGVRVAKSVYYLLDHPSPGLGFQLTSSTQDCADDIYRVVSLLLESEIPHNMVILRGEPFNEDEPRTPIIRALLVPRKPVYGEKVHLHDDGPPLAAAACELVQGFIPVRNESSYLTLTESDILQILEKNMISHDEFQQLLEKIKLLFQ